MATADYLNSTSPDLTADLAAAQAELAEMYEEDRQSLLARCIDNGWHYHEDFPGEDATLEEIDAFMTECERYDRLTAPLHPEDEAIERARVNDYPGSEWL